jgi:hypothetical protein
MGDDMNGTDEPGQDEDPSVHDEMGTDAELTSASEAQRELTAALLRQAGAASIAQLVDELGDGEPDDQTGDQTGDQIPVENS